ncbi:MAG: hypothetical protein K6F84_08315 [Lachnospiraceae bacterium]|nr:hypothetical protein [Lachnospiraceae bacterium]
MSNFRIKEKSEILDKVKVYLDDMLIPRTVPGYVYLVEVICYRYLYDPAASLIEACMVMSKNTSITAAAYKSAIVHSINLANETRAERDLPKVNPKEIINGCVSVLL